MWTSFMYLSNCFFGLFGRETLIFSAEVYAIDLALDLIPKSKNPKHVVFSYFQSAIVAIEKKKN